MYSTKTEKLQDKPVLAGQIYHNAGKGYVLRLTTTKECELSPPEVEVLSLLWFKTKISERTTKQTIINRLMIKERSVSTILAKLQKVQLIESIEIGRRNEWKTTTMLFKEAGFAKNKDNQLLHYRFYPTDGTIEQQNANRLYWLIVSIAKSQNRHYATFTQGGLATSLNMSKSTIKRCLARLRQQNRINWTGNEYTLLAPPETIQKIKEYESTSASENTLHRIESLDWTGISPASQSDLRQKMCFWTHLEKQGLIDAVVDVATSQNVKTDEVVHKLVVKAKPKAALTSLPELTTWLLSQFESQLIPKISLDDRDQAYMAELLSMQN